VLVRRLVFQDHQTPRPWSMDPVRAAEIAGTG
jgi:hypothetical protein